MAGYFNTTALIIETQPGCVMNSLYLGIIKTRLTGDTLYLHKKGGGVVVGSSQPGNGKKTIHHYFNDFKNERISLEIMMCGGQFMDKVIEKDIFKVWLGDDGIIYVEVIPNEEITLASARISSELRVQLAFGKTRPLLVDMSKVKSITREAREFYSKDESFVSAMALIIKSPVSKVIGNLFLSIDQPIYPVRLFTSKNEAIDWLRNLVE